MNEQAKALSEAGEQIPLLCFGTWSVWSTEDSRWNSKGQCFGWEDSGPREMYNWVQKCESELGEQPSDLCGMFTRSPDQIIQGPSIDILALETPVP